jgi:putative membrane protein
MMWNWGYGGLGQGLWWAGGLMMLVVWAAVITGVVFLVRFLVRQGSRHEQAVDALEILKSRYARGELSREEYERMRRDLA